MTLIKKRLFEMAIKSMIPTEEKIVCQEAHTVLIAYVGTNDNGRAFVAFATLQPYYPCTL